MFYLLFASGPLQTTECYTHSHLSIDFPVVGIYSALGQEKNSVDLPEYEIHSPNNGNNIRNEVLENIRLVDCPHPHRQQSYI